MPGRRRSVLATLQRAPAGNLLPLGQRMGLTGPEGLALQGYLSGVVGYSNHGGLEGQVSIDNAIATLPGLSPVHADHATGSLTPDHLHLDPFTISSSPVSSASRPLPIFQLSPAPSMSELPPIRPASPISPKPCGPGSRDVPVLEKLFPPGASPAKFTMLTRPRSPRMEWPVAAATWRDFAADGVASPLTGLTGKLVFDEAGVDARGFSATLDELVVQGEYHYSS